MDNTEKGTMMVDGIQLAHVSDAIEAITGGTGYDADADQAAGLLKRSQALQDTAAAYGQGTRSWDELVAEVKQALGR